MRIDVLTLFPEMFAPMEQSMMKRAIEKEKISFDTIDFRDFAFHKHNRVDDYVFGGGAGLLLKVEPIDRALKDLEKRTPETKKRVILLDPAGKKFGQSDAEELAKEEHLVFICGHYEGYDERIRTLVTDEYSIGDFVLTGGELGAMVIIDATVRLIPDVLGNYESAIGDSHSMGLLEHPQYTRPREYEGMEVPEVLFSGNHAKIATWQKKESLRRTYQRRPDLLENYSLDKEEEKLLQEIIQEESMNHESETIE